jgi:DNA-binding MarR family transcriptional regulator
MFELAVLQREVTRLLDVELAPSGLSAEDFAVYSALARGLTRPGDIAGFLRFPPTTVSSVIRRLEARGHVAYGIDDADRRARHVTLTPAGVGAHRRASRLFDSAVGRLELPVAAQSLAGLLKDVRSVIADVRSGAKSHELPAGSRGF